MLFEVVQILRKLIIQELRGEISGELRFRDICCLHLHPPPSTLLPILFFFLRGREGVRLRRKGGREEKKKKSLLTHKLVNAVALSTFSSNENFRHLHINLISCVSLSSLPLLH